MDTLTSILVLLSGVLLRLLVPLSLTALVVFVLRKLDARWQAEAELEMKLLAKDETPCWREQGLSLDRIEQMSAASGKPCWQIKRLPNGYLREECLGCEAFLSAPMPSPKYKEAHA
jgi:hypothetical protein